MKTDAWKIERRLLKERRICTCHSRLNSFEGSKKLKQMLFIGSRKREIVQKLLHMIKYVLLKMLPELHRRLQRLLLKHKLKLLLKYRHRLMHKHRHRQHRLLLKLDSWNSTLRLSDSKTFLKEGKLIKNH